MTRISNKYPALARAQKWLAEHGDPLPEPGTQRHKALLDKARAANSRSGRRTGIPVRDSGAIAGHPRVATGPPPAGGGRAPVDISHHERHCTICQHPERGTIEEAFLQWRSVARITDEFDLPSRTAVYRHAHAFNLFPRRSRNLRFALGLLIERAEGVTVTAESIVSAVRAYTRVTDAGEWVEPPSHVIVSSGTRLAERSPGYARRVSGRRAKALAPAPHESQITSHESQVSAHESRVLTATHPETENDANR